jgi:hypothetical protein
MRTVSGTQGVAFRGSLIGACVLAGLTLAAEQRSSGYLLTVDFLAVDSTRRPVDGLRATEVALKVGGKPAELVSLKLLPAASDSSSQPLRSTLPFGSAESVDFERKFLIVVDDESLPQGSEQSTRDAIVSFLERLSSKDQVGLLVVPHGGTRLPLTTDHSQIARAVLRLAGRATGGETVSDAACRTGQVLRELDTVLARAESPSGPVMLVLFSGSMYDGGGAVQVPFGTPMACHVQLSDFRQVGLRAARSRGYTYIVQPDTFNRLQWTSSPRSGLEQLAGVTGGRILQLSGRDRDVLEAIRLETSAIYTARVRVDDQVRAAQTFDVRTSRPDVTIVARPQITVPSGAFSPR